MNRPCIQRTTFIDHPSGDKSYGYRFYDDHGQTYCNTLAENIFEMTPGDFLRHVENEFDNVAESIFDYALEHGIYVDDEYFTFKVDDKDGTWELVNSSE